MTAWRFLLLCVPLGLSACSARPLNLLRGEVRSWTHGPGSVEARSDDALPLATAELDRVGRFTLTLPAARTTAPLQGGLVPRLSAGCRSTVRASPATRFYTLSELTAHPVSGPKRAYTLVSEDRGVGVPQRVTRRLLVYAIQAVRVTGQVSCPVDGGRALTSYGLNLRAGWNRVTSSRSGAAGVSRTSIGNAGEDGFERWSVSSTP